MRYIFITGNAGCGKSYTLKEMTQGDNQKHVIVAPTGIAAINAGGFTVHSAFRIDPGNGFVDPKIKYGALRGVKRVYLDEVSMVSADLMKSIFHACEILGVEELICFGDLAQLKPVSGAWFFEFKVPDEVVRLTKNYRQGSDLEFAEVLNRMRSGRHTVSDINYLNSKAGATNKGITLAYSNAAVNSINELALKSLPGAMIENAAAIDGNMKASDVQAPEVLQIKPGAQIVMLNNDTRKRWQNGTRGKIVEIIDPTTDWPTDVKEGDEVAINQPSIKVQIGDQVHVVTEHTWIKRVPKMLTPERTEYYQAIADGEHELSFIESIMLTDGGESQRAAAQHTLDQGYEMESTGTFTQFPMKLGYASTVHKSQGLTLNEVIVKPDGFGNAHGLGYVALSRLTNVGGLSTFRKLRKDDFICNPKVIPYL